MSILWHAFLVTVGIGLGWCLILAVLLIVMDMAVRGQKKALDDHFDRYAEDAIRTVREWEK